jgi:hypothetical protein
MQPQSFSHARAHAQLRESSGLIDYLGVLLHSLNGRQHSRIDALCEEMRGVREEVRGVREEVRGMCVDLAGMHAKLDALLLRAEAEAACTAADAQV